MMKTLQDYNVFFSKRQQEIVNTLVESNPILATVPVKTASHGYKHAYAKVTRIQGPQEVQRDEELPEVGISFELADVTLGKIGGKLPIPKDSARQLGGYDRFVNDRVPSILANGANSNEKKIYYDGFVKFAVQNGRMYNGGGSTADAQSSMVAVHWDYATTCGLINPNAPSTHRLFETSFLNGGYESEIAYTGADSQLHKTIGKVFVIEMEYGLMLGNPNYVAGIANIEFSANVSDPDKIDGLPSPMQIGKLISSVRGTPGSTYVYCSPMLLQALAVKYNLGKVYINGSQNPQNVRYDIRDWNGIRFVSSYNLLDGTEAKMSGLPTL